tara:strand:+ start:521 stop:1009 length:489 start_codon:yes stop_codon:yes gene_type:complete
MKARIVNGKIVKYPKLPRNFGNVIGGFENSSTEVLEGYGFYDIITPSYDSKTQYISNLHTIDDYEDLDGKKRTVFIYDVKTKTFSETLAELKEKKIEELKSVAYNKLSSTDWYVTRKAEKGTAIPDDIETERDNIRSSVDTKESEIKAITKKVDVFNYDTTL